MNFLEYYYVNLKKNYINFFLIFFIWSSLFISLNSNFYEFIHLFKNLNFVSIVNSRSFLIIFSFFLVIFLVAKKGIKIKGNLFYFLLLTLLSVSSIYFFSNEFEIIHKISYYNVYEKDIFSIKKYGLQLQSVQLFASTFVSVFLFLIFNENKNKDAFVFTFIVFLGIFFIFYLFLYFSSLPRHLKSDSILLYSNSFFSHNAQIFFEQPSVRITGIGRSLVIISAILCCIYLSVLNKNKFIKLFLILFIIFINVSIIFTGSRFALYSFITTYFVLIILLKSSFLKKIKYFLIFVILPFFLFFILGNFLNEIQIKNKIKNKIENKIENSNNIIINDSSINNSIKNNTSKSIELLKNSRYLKNINNTSGRTQIWLNSLEVINEKKNYLFGNGINADRRLLFKYNDIFGSSVSNGFLNVFLSSGITGLIIIVLANLIILKNIFNFIFVEKCFSNFDKYYLINLSILVIFIFYQKIIFENSFTTFGLDYLIYIACSYFILNKVNKFNIN